ncbi:MAG TPA: transcription antitermination factor NusB [Dokdonella sp.]
MTEPERHASVDPAARSRARRRALQAIYAWQLSDNRIETILAQFRDEQDMQVADLEYFEDLVRGVERGRAELDAGLEPFLDREIERVDPIERAVLRIAAYELRERLDVPYRVVINEAVETTKRFGAEHGHTYVNGVLDKLAATWRSAEYREAATRAAGRPERAGR